MNKAKEFAKAHIDACECWEHGGIDHVWMDEDGNTCIRYEDGHWWHYTDKHGCTEWW